MQSPLSERNPDATYRITQIPMPKPDEYSVYSIYVYVGEELVTGTYRFDMLAQWIQDAIAALDVAGAGVGVPNIGRRIGGTYWIGKGLDGELFGL